MPFDLDTWKSKLKDQLQGWKPRMQHLGVESVYTALSTAALVPVYQAYFQDGGMAVGLALGQVAGAVGGSLIANQIQGWKDKSEAQIARELEEQVAGDAALRLALDQALEKLDALPMASAALDPADRAWFVETLRSELALLGSTIQITSIQVQDGAAAAGNNNIVVGAGGMYVGGKVGGDVVGPHGTLVKAPDPRQIQAEKLDKARRRYLESLRRHCQVLPLPALGADETAEASITLDRVYIDLDTTTQVPLTEEEKQSRKGRQVALERGEETRLLSSLEAAQAAPRLALLGDPGAGKSTFLRKLLAWQAAACLGEARPPQGFAPDLLPILIVLRDLTPALSRLEIEKLPDRQKPQVLVKLVREQIQADLRLLEAEAFAGALVETLRSGGCLLALDGLDEVPVTLRPRVRQLVAALLGEYDLQRVLLTCRIRSYVGEAVVPGFQTHTLAEFDPDKVRRFCSAWYRAQQELGRVNPEQARRKADDLAQAVLTDDLRELSSNPMMLTTMAIIHQKEIGLPSERVRLYNLAVDILLRRWQKHKAGEVEMAASPALAEFLKDDLRLRSAVERLAYQAHCARRGKDQTIDLQRGQALTLLESPQYLGQAGLADEFMDYVDQRAGLLVGRGGGPGHPAMYSFPHRTFQEYLAGCYMVSQRDLGREFFARAGEGDIWSLAAQLGAEELLYNRRSQNPLLDLAYQLCVEPGDDQHQRALLWSGEVAALLGREKIEGDAGSPQGGLNYLENLLPRLVTLLGSQLDPPERAEAGRALGILGDPRPQVMSINGMELCFVPQGPFWMGSDRSQDTDAWDDEEPLHEVQLPTFWIARHPVSNAQFQEFVQAGGYRGDHYWEEAARQGVWKDGVINRRAWAGEGFRDEAAMAPYDYGRPFNLPNHPVVGICWYEALAFCRWLADQWQAKGYLPKGWQVKLPSEAEWEKAARGGLQILDQMMVRPAVGGLENTDPSQLVFVENTWPARGYPWGNGFDPDNVNYDEAGVKSTSALGCFPRGASPYGAFDLSGNVWEWTRSLWDNYPYPINTRDRNKRESLSAEKELPRVLRGGAFNCSRGGVRCAFRLRCYPDFGDDDLGFRVVVSPA